MKYTMMGEDIDVLRTLVPLGFILVVGYLSSTYRDGIAVLILILVLLWRPTGILGIRRTEKV